MMRAYFTDRLHRRFILGVSLMLLPVLALAISSYVLHRMAAGPASASMAELTDEIVPARRLQILLLKAQMPVHDHLIAGDRNERQRFDELGQAIDGAFSALAAADTFVAAEERRQLTAARMHWQKARSIASHLMAAAPQAGNETKQRMRRFDHHVDAAVAGLDRTIAIAEQELHAYQQSIMAKIRRFLIAAAAALALAVVLVVAVGWMLARSVLAPVGRLSQCVRDLANGELKLNVNVKRKDELGQLTAAFNAMAAKLQENRRLLERLATHDSLTGLLHHGEFLKQLKTEVARSRRYGHPFSLLMLDVDHFKSVNDNHGHQAGDTVLKAVAGILGKSARPADIAARYGGEEFVLILPETDAQAAFAVAERLRETMGRYPIVIRKGKHLNVTVSIGVACFPADADKEEALIAAADQALYAAKKAGRDRVCRFTDITGESARAS